MYYDPLGNGAYCCWTLDKHNGRDEQSYAILNTSSLHQINRWPEFGFIGTPVIKRNRKTTLLQVEGKTTLQLIVSVFVFKGGDA